MFGFPELISVLERFLALFRLFPGLGEPAFEPKVDQKNSDQTEKEGKDKILKIEQRKEPHDRYLPPCMNIKTNAPAMASVPIPMTPNKT